MQRPCWGSTSWHGRFFVALDDTSEQTISEEILDSAQLPQSTTVDGVTTSAHSLPDQIAAAKFVAARQAAAGGAPWGVAFAKLRSPGAQC